MGQPSRLWMKNRVRTEYELLVCTKVLRELTVGPDVGWILGDDVGLVVVGLEVGCRSNKHWLDMFLRSVCMIMRRKKLTSPVSDGLFEGDDVGATLGFNGSPPHPLSGLSV